MVIVRRIAIILRNLFHEQPTIIPTALIPVKMICMAHSLMILWRDSVIPYMMSFHLVRFHLDGLLFRCDELLK